MAIVDPRGGLLELTAEDVENINRLLTRLTLVSRAALLTPVELKRITRLQGKLTALAQWIRARVGDRIPTDPPRADE
jgi:hypothetical protein